MPEPTSTTAAAAATYAAAGAALPVITAFGVPLGLRADVLIAGFFGSLVAIILLNSVPGDVDTWRTLVRTTVRRLAVALASSLTAGYLTPLVVLVSSLPDALLMGVAFAVGGGAQHFLAGAIERMRAVTLPKGGAA